MPDTKRKEVITTDLAERAVERNLLSAVARRDKWRIVDYEFDKLGPWQGAPFPVQSAGTCAGKV